MQRCLELAQLGAGSVAPNPMVGAVLVQGDCIIGEGSHQQYGGPHAEVYAIRQAISNGYTDLSQSTLYVSLEPCAHVGKTPPCADLIIRYKIPTVVIGCRDPFKEVNGKGIEKLRSAGVVVETGILENKCRDLNKRFFTFHTAQRPYVILKWAETADGIMAAPPPPAGVALESSKHKMSLTQSEPEIPLAETGRVRLLISNEYSNRLVHRWRSEEAAILVGTNTALLDNPELTTRLWSGPSPVRLVVDMNLRLPGSLKLFNGKVKTIVFNTIRQEEKENLLYYKLEKDSNLVPQLLNALYQLNIQSLMVEGGAQLLQSFIDEGIWDEARVIKSATAILPRAVSGLDAPVLKNVQKISEQKFLSDTITLYKP